VKDRYGLNSSPQMNIYFGDSMTHGIIDDNNAFKNFPTYCEKANSAAGLLSGGINLGIGSAPLGLASTPGTLAYMMETYWGTALRDTGRVQQVVVMWTGANDIVQLGSTGAQIYAADQAICAYIHSLGYLIVRVSIPAVQDNGTAPFDATNFETQRQAWLALMASDHSFVDVYVDYSGNVEIGLNTSYVSFGANFNDWIHFTPTGNQIIAPLVSAGIVSIS
jgi:lysophospholipase L1-like esterase